MQLRRCLNIALGLCFLAAAAIGQESPYFVTYNHHMEEPRHLEVAITPIVGAPREGNRFVGTALELEYGTTGWWTTELYLDAQSTAHESTLFTGYRIENRFRLLMREHAVNPVLYVEYAATNGADKALREIVGFDSWHGLATPNAEARTEKEREIETKLILSRDQQGWNMAGNLIAEKNLDGNPWEFGYSLGASRPFTMSASPVECRFCAENFSGGLEMYGGAGDQRRITLANTSHYIAPAVAWTLPSGVTLRLSPTFGLTSSSSRFLLRFAVSYEVPLLR